MVTQRIIDKSLSQAIIHGLVKYSGQIPQFIRVKIMTLEWYHWAIAGVLMVLSELAVPTLVLVWFGAGALVVALALALIPGLELLDQLVLWLVLSLALITFWFRILKPYRSKTLAGRSSAQVIGEVGLLVGDIGKFQKGQVRFQSPVIGAQVWDCIADDPILAGTRVRIVSVEGSILKVTSAEKNL